MSAVERASEASSVEQANARRVEWLWIRRVEYWASMFLYTEVIPINMSHENSMKWRISEPEPFLSGQISSIFRFFSKDDLMPNLHTAVIHKMIMQVLKLNWKVADFKIRLIYQILDSLW